MILRLRLTKSDDGFFELRAIAPGTFVEEPELDPGRRCLAQVRDLWARKDLGRFTDNV